MKIRNISKNTYQHNVGLEVYTINPGEMKDVPEEVAKVWLKTGLMESLVDEAKEKELAELKAENEKLKAEKKNEGHGFPVNAVPDEDTEFRDVEEEKPSKTTKKTNKK